MVSRCLRKEFKLKSYKPAAKPCLTSATKKSLSFANKYHHRTMKKWKTVLFFNKSTVQQFTVQKSAEECRSWKTNAKESRQSTPSLQ